MQRSTKAVLVLLLAGFFFSLNAQASSCKRANLTDFDGTIAEAAGAVPELSTLLDIVIDLELDGALADEDAYYTVFAPTNEAFANLLASPLGAIAADEEALLNTVLYHVVPGWADPRRVWYIREVPTLESNGQTLYVKRNRSSAKVNQSEVNCAGFRTNNGLVFLMDSVVIPQQ